MGLFSFIKNAGAKVFGIGKTDKEEAAEAAAENAAKIKEANEKAASSMEETVSDLGLEAENLNVTIEGDTATITGKALDQATREKIVLVVGNTAGIAQVDDQMEVENKEPEAQFHTVEKGDSLSKIAKKYYTQLFLKLINQCLQIQIKFIQDKYYVFLHKKINYIFIENKKPVIRQVFLCCK
jgi:nucleoid-associated protein YgaU